MFLTILDEGSRLSYLKMSWRDVCKNDYWLVTKLRKQNSKWINIVYPKTVFCNC